MSGSVDEERISGELKGNTLRVYLYVLKSAGSNVGVREVQRALGFSSPRLAAYYLEKLEELGLVENKLGQYFLVKEVKVGVLRHFLKFGRIWLPRYLFYAAMYTTFLIYIVVRFEEINTYSVFALILSILGSAIFWYETIRMWHQKP